MAAIPNLIRLSRDNSDTVTYQVLCTPRSTLGNKSLDDLKVVLEEVRYLCNSAQLAAHMHLSRRCSVEKKGPIYRSLLTIL